MEVNIQTKTQVKLEEIEYNEPGINSEEAKLIANSLFIDTSPNHQRDENLKRENFDDGSISDCSSHSDDVLSKRMKLKSQFGSGFDNSANTDTVFTDNQPLLTDFSCPVKYPADDKVTNDDEEISNNDDDDDDDETLSVNDDTSDEDYVPDEEMSGDSSNDDIIYNEPPPKRKVRRSQSKQTFSAKPTPELSTKVVLTSIPTNVISIIASNASQITNLSGKYIYMILLNFVIILILQSFELIDW